MYIQRCLLELGYLRGYLINLDVMWVVTAAALCLGAWAPPRMPIHATPTLPHTRTLWPVLMSATPETMSYRELQAACKAAGIGARGKADELRSKLREHLTSQSPDDAAADGGMEAPHYELNHLDTDVELEPARADPAGAGTDEAPDSSELDPFDALDELFGQPEEGLKPLASDSDSTEAAPVLDPLLVVDEQLDPLGELTAAAARADSFDDSLFDQLLQELDEPAEDGLSPLEEPVGVFRAPKQTRPSSGATSADGISDLLESLDALDALDQPAAGGVAVPPASKGGSAFAPEEFDEKWLDDIFGPIGPPSSPSGGGGREDAGWRQRGGAPSSGSGWQPRAQTGGRLQGWGAPKEGRRERAAPRAWPDTYSGPHGDLRRDLLGASARGDHGNVLTLLSEWRASEAAPVDEQVYHSGLKACELMGNWAVAASLINELEESGSDLHANHFDMALRACDRHARWQEALALLDRMQRLGLRPTTRTLECAMRTCAKAKQHPMVHSLWDLMREETQASPPLVPTTFTYNVLMRALAESGMGKGVPHPKRKESASAVLKAFHEATETGIELDESAYKHALRASDISGDHNGALGLLQMMRERGLPLDVLVYGNVMNACARNGRAQTVMQLLAQMRADGLQPNSFCYNAAIGAASRADRPRQAFDLMEEMEQEAVRLNDMSVGPTTHTFTAVLRSCAASAQWRTAQQLLGKMIKGGHEPTAYHYGSVIEACSRAGEVGKVMGFMKDMQSRGLDPDVKTFTTALGACARENQLNRALSLVERMYKLEVKPDVATYNVLLQACDKQSKHAIIEQLIMQMPLLGVEPNLVNYNTAVRSLARGGEGTKVRPSPTSSPLTLTHTPHPSPPTPPTTTQSSKLNPRR